MQYVPWTMAAAVQSDVEVSVGFAIGEKFPSYSALKEKISDTKSLQI